VLCLLGSKGRVGLWKRLEWVLGVRVMYSERCVVSFQDVLGKIIIRQLIIFSFEAYYPQVLWNIPQLMMRCVLSSWLEAIL